MHLGLSGITRTAANEHHPCSWLLKRRVRESLLGRHTCTLAAGSIDTKALTCKLCCGALCVCRELKVPSEEFGHKQNQTYTAQAANNCAYAFARMFPPVTICRQRVAHINRLSEPPECLLANRSKVTLPPLIAAHIAPGNDVSFPLPDSSTATVEILVAKNSGRDVYQAPIGYVT